MAEKKVAKIPDDIAAMSFEEALAALEDVVSKLESGQVGLEDSIDIYSRGALLKQHCETKLAAAQARIEKVVMTPDGPAAEPSDLE